MARKPRTDTTSEGAKAPKQPDAAVAYWLSEFEAFRKREKDYRKEGERILEIFGGEKKTTQPFNILYSNTETLLPSLYSAVARPLVQRRFKDADPIGKLAAQAGQRMLEFLIDTNIEGYETFDEAARAATLDAILPGRGVTSVKYDAEVSEMAPAAEGEAATPYTKSELVCLEAKTWNRVYFGYARKWSKVPWIAYEMYIDKPEAERLFGKKIAADLKYTDGQDAREEEKDKTDDERNTGAKKSACVYQIWDKDGGRKIRYVSDQWKEGYLKVDDDPLGLTGFYDCPRPLQMIDRPHNLVPVALYTLYENQAQELNRLTLRINKIVDAIRARGAYDTSLGDDLKKLMSADDNELIPAETSSTLAAEKGLGNAIWFLPIEQLVNTLRELYVAREACKRVIYEITGIADILRGSSVASETLGAQEIKERWGSLRLKRLQKEVQRYVRDLLRMMLEMAATRFSETTWARMTGLPFLTAEQKAQLDQMAAAVKMQAAQMAAAGQKPTPQQVQQVQQLQQQLQQPTWAQVLGVLKDDTQRAFRIDIETNSTIEPEAAQDKQDIAEMMTAMGQVLNGIGPLVQSGVLPFQVAQSLLLMIARRFRFGVEIEDLIKTMQAPKPEDDGKAKEQAAKEQQFAQEKTQGLAKIAQLENALKQTEREKTLDAKASKIAIDEIKLGSEKQLFELVKAATKKGLNDDFTMQKERLAGDQKVKQVQEQSSKREQQVAKSADTKITQAVTSLQKTVTDLAKMQADILAAIGEPLRQNQQIMASMTEAVTQMAKAVGAPRKRTAVRDKAGRLDYALDEPMPVN